jgi:hypothetical protein
MCIENGNRRQGRRYAIQLELQYKLLRRQQVVLYGGGVTSNISSGGVAFRTENVLPPGSPVELAIDWPVLLQNTCALKLVIFGRVVRSGERGTAIRLSRYEFRTHAGHTHSAAVN